MTCNSWSDNTGNKANKRSIVRSNTIESVGFSVSTALLLAVATVAGGGETRGSYTWPIGISIKQGRSMVENMWISVSNCQGNKTGSKL